MHTYLLAFPKPFLSHVLTYGVLTMLGPGEQSEDGRVPALTVLLVCVGRWACGVELCSLCTSLVQIQLEALVNEGESMGVVRQRKRQL